MGAQATKIPEQQAAAAPAATQQPAAGGGDGEKKPKCKACCACPETKRVRDDCIVSKGEENCQDLIEAHKKCMRDMGFNI